MGATAPALAPPATPPATAVATGGAGGRHQSVDIIRGLACVLMAIDHVRVYSGVPAGGPTPGVFFTRWVTHFVAPTFALLAGTSAYLLGRRLGDTGKLARFLVSRGALLVVLEMSFIRWSWAFHVNYAEFNLAGVIWMLGWCMILLGAMVRLRPVVVGWIGVGIVLFQQVFALVPRALPEGMRGGFSYFWEFIYSSGFDAWPGIAILYVIVPWIGVMAAGYGFGLVLERPDVSRRRTLYRLGTVLTVVFLLAGSAFASRAGDGAPPFWVRLLNQQKYPASQLFLMMTLGPMILLMPWAERARGPVARVLETFGRVPMFYYLAHILVIHSLSVLAMMVFTGGAFNSDWYSAAPYTGVPGIFRWSLSQLYLVYAVAMAALLPLCVWYARAKRDRPAWWMRYI
jgi:uncharacterized membrane protein